MITREDMQKVFKHLTICREAEHWLATLPDTLTPEEVYNSCPYYTWLEYVAGGLAEDKLGGEAGVEYRKRSDEFYRELRSENAEGETVLQTWKRCYPYSLFESWAEEVLKKI